MRIEHLAIWVEDLEKMRSFYVEFFGLESNEKYHNPVKKFSSYFLSSDEGARIELMQKPNIQKSSRSRGEQMGLAHFAISLGSKSEVDKLTDKAAEMRVKVVGAPRTTGDGYYESVIEDPEGNWIELTV